MYTINYIIYIHIYNILYYYNSILLYSNSYYTNSILSL